MSQSDDTQPNRGRPVLKRVELVDEHEDDYKYLRGLMEKGELWMFCGEFQGRENDAADAAHDRKGHGIYKVFPSGSWPGGYLRD